MRGYLVRYSVDNYTPVCPTDRHVYLAFPVIIAGALLSAQESGICADDKSDLMEFAWSLIVTVRYLLRERRLRTNRAICSNKDYGAIKIL